MPGKSDIKFTVAEIAKTISAKIIGDDRRIIKAFCPLNEPVDNGLSFSKSSNSGELKLALLSNKLTAVILPSELDAKLESYEIVQLIVEDPLNAISVLSKKYLSLPLPKPGISKLSDVASTAIIGSDVHIGAFSSVGEYVEISDGVTIFPHVVIYPHVKIRKNAVLHSGSVVREGCVIGENCIVQNGAIIGADGFGYFLNSAKKLEAVPQVGNVELAEDVEVGANSCIDRATLGVTRIGAMTKVDNLVQIGHNTQIGQASIICGNAGIAGSCNIGSGVTLGGGVGVADHINIASGVRVGGNSGITSDLTEKADYLGYPAIKAGDWKRQIKSLEKLPALIGKLKKL